MLLNWYLWENCYAHHLSNVLLQRAAFGVRFFWKSGVQRPILVRWATVSSSLGVQVGDLGCFPLPGCFLTLVSLATQQQKRFLENTLSLSSCLVCEIHHWFRIRIICFLFSFHTRKSKNKSNNAEFYLQNVSTNLNFKANGNFIRIVKEVATFLIS